MGGEGERIGYVRLLPCAGESFFMLLEDKTTVFGTSMVLHVWPDKRFRTLNSIYQYEILDDDKEHETNPGGLGKGPSQREGIPHRERPLGRGITEEVLDLIQKVFQD